MRCNNTAQDLTAYQKKEFIRARDTLRYRLLLPDGFDASKKYPLVLLLHGAGERGSDNEAQLTYGSSLFLADSNRKAFPAIVVFPQCPASSFWSNVQITTNSSRKPDFTFQEDGAPTKGMALLESWLPQLLQQYNIDLNRVYAMGLSMGGMGTFEIVRRHPGLFAAAIPICGGAHPATAAALTGLPWWVFHGGKDNVVPPQLSEAMVAALEAQHASVKFTVYPEAGHNSWDSAFAEPQLLPWLFAQHK